MKREDLFLVGAFVVVSIVGVILSRFYPAPPASGLGIGIPLADLAFKGAFSLISGLLTTRAYPWPLRPVQALLFGSAWFVSTAGRARIPIAVIAAMRSAVWAGATQGVGCVRFGSPRDGAA